MLTQAKPTSGLLEISLAKFQAVLTTEEEEKESSASSALGAGGAKAPPRYSEKGYFACKECDAGSISDSRYVVLLLLFSCLLGPKCSQNLGEGREP